MTDVQETTRYDVIILGGGPAGTATALSLRNHNPALSVAIVERSTYSAPRIGETVPPQTVALFQRLGLWERFRERGFLPSYGTSAAWGDPNLHVNEFIFNPFGHGWHLDRRMFDQWLAHEAENKGVALYIGSRVVDQQRHEDVWDLTLQLPTEQRRLLGRFVVDATGRLAVFARRQRARRIILDQLVGAFVFFDLDASLADTYTMVEAWEDGWWYSALLPDSQMVVACMSDADLVKEHRLRSSDHWMSFLERTHHTKARLTHASPGAAPTVHAAHSFHLDRTTGDGWLAVGDAATTFDPLSSQGIFKALRSGTLAAYAICDDLNGDSSALEKYETLMKQEFNAYLETWRSYYHQERRWPDSAFWKRRNGDTELVSTAR